MILRPKTRSWVAETTGRLRQPNSSQEAFKNFLHDGTKWSIVYSGYMEKGNNFYVWGTQACCLKLNNVSLINERCHCLLAAFLAASEKCWTNLYYWDTISHTPVVFELVQNLQKCRYNDENFRGIVNWILYKTYVLDFN